MAYWKLLRMILPSAGDPPKGRVECSNCGYHIDKYNYEPLPDQCPNCGEGMGGIKINWWKDTTATTTEPNYTGTDPNYTGTLPKYGMNGWQNNEPTLLPPFDVPKMTGGMVGWTCPVCGRGLSPFISCCPCKGQLKFEITC